MAQYVRIEGNAEPCTIHTADATHDPVRQLARDGQVIEAISYGA